MPLTPSENTAQFRFPGQQAHNDTDKDFCKFVRLFPVAPWLRNIPEPLDQRTSLESCLIPPPVLSPAFPEVFSVPLIFLIAEGSLKSVQYILLKEGEGLLNQRHTLF